MWLGYAGAGLAVTLVLAAAATLVVEPRMRLAIWFAAAVAYALQLASFAVLVGVRAGSELFMAAWLGGMVARFGTVALVAAWLARSEALPRGATLLGLVAFLFVLLLMEPVFLRRGLRTR